MNYVSTQAGPLLQIRLSGEFTFTDNDQFQRMANEILKSASKEVELDFAGLEFIDSAALSMLLVIRESTKKQGKKLIIKNSQGRVKEVLEEMKFSKFVPTRQ